MGKGACSVRKSDRSYKMILSALFLALAYVMPFLTGQIQQFGAMLCPMHIPVLLCGFFCGGSWGLAVGLIAPLFRAFTLGAPAWFPNAVCMAAELATYGAVAGVMHRLLSRKKPYIYLSLITAMLVGRVVWGAAMFVCVGGFGMTMFLAGALFNAIPGIVVQLVVIPLLVMLLEKPSRGDRV